MGNFRSFPSGGRIATADVCAFAEGWSRGALAIRSMKAPATLRKAQTKLRWLRIVAMRLCSQAVSARPRQAYAESISSSSIVVQPDGRRASTPSSRFNQALPFCNERLTGGCKSWISPP